MNFVDIIVEASSVERTLVEKTWQITYRLRVVDSPAGSIPPECATQLRYASRDIQWQIAELEQGRLDQIGMIALGRTLGALLLPERPVPTSVYDLFIRSLDLVGPEDGVRLRLRLPPLLAALPWEYSYLDRVGNPDSIDGFLALNPRVAIIRDEVMPTPSTWTPPSASLSVLVAMASADGLAPLDLAQEEADLREALDGQPGLRVTYVRNATLDEVLNQIPGARIFHYAGHATFEQRGGDVPGTYSGTGSLALLDQLVDAEQLAVNLSAGGVRLVVLGGCNTGRRDGVSVWSGIAPTLIRSHAQVPAVVAYQFSIRDASAVAFSRAFYRALVGGLGVESAVAIGRIAIYNQDTQGRDWGVPVLYLRPGDGYLFAGADDQALRKAARTSAEVSVKVQAQRVASSGYVSGAEVGVMREGRLIVDVRFGDVMGEALGLGINTATGGAAQVEVKADTVEGKLSGLRIDILGGIVGADDGTH
jgi:hypothetical protein